MRRAASVCSESAAAESFDWSSSRRLLSNDLSSSSLALSNAIGAASPDDEDFAAELVGDAA